VPTDSSTHVALAGAGLALGAATAAWTPPTRRRRVGAAVAGTAVLVGLVAVAFSGHLVSRIAHTRLSAASSDRAHEWAAAFDVARHHLILGIGTARVLLQWREGGKLYTATFAHNEFLQLLTQDGVVGLGVLLVGLAFVFVRLAHRRGRAGAWSAECGIACLVALLAQSSLDFLWHLPVIPVLMAVVLAVATSEGQRGEAPVASPAVASSLRETRSGG